MAFKYRVSDDGRFLGVTNAGAHCDTGGSHILNGLSSLNFNLMTDYINGLMGGPLISKVPVPVEPEMNVIHNLVEHRAIYIGVSERTSTALRRLEEYFANPCCALAPRATRLGLA